MTPLKQQISLIPFSIEHWYSPYKRRRFENRSRSGWLLVVIRIFAWIPVFHFLRHWGIGDFPTFVCISRFSQFSYNQQPISTKLGEMNDADECIHNFVADIRRTSGSRLIRKSEFESRSLLFQILASADVCTLYYRTSLISKIQNVWSDQFSKRRRLWGLYQCSI